MRRMARRRAQGESDPFVATAFGNPRISLAGSGENEDSLLRTGSERRRSGAVGQTLALLAAATWAGTGEDMAMGATP